MKSATSSSFSEGMIMDLNPMVTPQNCLVDCLNGTLITYNGNEFTLQTDLGNVPIEQAKLPAGYIPLGIKEYGGIIYLALYNPTKGSCEIGSVPSPDYSQKASKDRSQGISISLTDNIEGDRTSYNQSTGKYKKPFNFSSSFTKLFEFEQMELNPGDKYVLGYVLESAQATDILSGPSIYKVKLYAVGQDNKLYNLSEPNVLKYSNLESVSPEDYRYFDNTVSSILALEINIDNVDWFNASGYESGDYVILDLYGKNKLKNTENRDDDLYIMGCKIEQTLKNDIISKTFYDYDNRATKTETYKSQLKLSKKDDLDLIEYPNGGSLEGVDYTGPVKYDITPFDQYTYLDHLKKTITINIGEKYVPGVANTIFKYKFSQANKSIRIDFNLPSIGMENPMVYLEFYDIWSDYSVIVPVDSVNPAGYMSVFVDTITEPVENIYNSDNRGGTPESVLNNWNVSDQNETYKIYKPFMSTKVRNKMALREDGLYVVKMSLIDRKSIGDEDGQLDINNLQALDYQNIYKLLAVNTAGNSKYDQLNESSASKNIDFNELISNDSPNVIYSGELKELKVDVDTTEVNNLQFKTLVKNTINDYYYYDIKDSKPTLQEDNYSCTYIVNSKNSIDLSLSGKTDCIGEISVSNPSSISILENNLSIRNDDSTVNSTVEANVYSDSGYKLDIELKTTRTLTAQQDSEQKNTTTVIRKYYMSNQIGSYGTLLANNSCYMVHMDDNSKDNGYRRFPKRARDRRNVDLINLGENNKDVWLKPDHLYELINKFDKSAIIIKMNDDTNDNQKSRFEYWEDQNKKIQEKTTNWSLAFKTGNTSAAIINYNSAADVVKILKDLYYPIYSDGVSYPCFYTSVDFHPSSRSEVSGNMKLLISSTLTIYHNAYGVKKIGDISYGRYTDTTTLLRDLKTLLNLRGLTDYNIQTTNYFSLSSIPLSNEVTVEPKTFGITAAIPEKIRKYVVDSKSMVYQNNPGLIVPEEKDERVISESGNYDFVANRFSAIKENNSKVVFIYNPQSLLTNMKWKEHKGNKNYDFRAPAFDYDSKEFDKA